jgi:hypothetical protein
LAENSNEFGRWNDMDYQLRFIRRDDGLVEVWMNGSRIVSYKGVTAFNVGDINAAAWASIAPGSAFCTILSTHPGPATPRTWGLRFQDLFSLVESDILHVTSNC